MTFRREISFFFFFFAAYQILRYSSIFFSWSKNSCDIFHWLRQNVERFFPELRCCLSKPLTISYFLLLVEKVHVIFLLVEKVHVRSRDLPKTRLRISPLSREFKILSPRIHLCFFSKRKNKGEMRRRPVKWKSDKNWWNFTGNRPFFMGIQSEIWPFQIP